MSPSESDRYTPPYLLAARDFERNEPQRRAYESKGHCVVLAGPGSGKTKVLTVKLARLLGEDVREPRGLACGTYNNECARELVRRLDRLGVRGHENVLLGTVHSFCLKAIVLPYAGLAGIKAPRPDTGRLRGGAGGCLPARAGQGGQRRRESGVLEAPLRQIPTQFPRSRVSGLVDGRAGRGGRRQRV